MKISYIKLLFSTLAAATLFSCHDLDVPVTTALTTDVFPSTDEQFISAAGPVYVALRGNFGAEAFQIASYSTDEGIMPARGGNWYDGGQNQTLHLHTWTVDNGYVNGHWTWLSTIIGVANQSISILEGKMPEGAAKQTMLSEIRTVRAFAYFMMMDAFGNVPIYTEYGDFAPKTNTPRTEVFNFIEKEILEAMPNLNEVSGVSQYGRPNKWAAYALLAKMYLNAEYYTGTKRYDDCIAACDKITASGLYSLEPKSSYLNMFYPTNGPQMKEFIFAIPYDPAQTNTFPFRSVNNRSRYDIPRSETKKFSLPFTPAGSASTLPEYYANFNDPNDVRNGQWLKGPQFMNDGVTPVTVTTTNIGYDQFYTGSNPSAPYTYQVNITPEVVLRQSVSAFDAGNDEIAWHMGYRNMKFYPDASSLNRNQNNDIPVFRYSDVVLMKAEAILRGGTPTLGSTALSLVNDLRAQRTTSPALTSVNLDFIYAERAREFAWEGWRRNDMIRFGKFEGKWGYKTDSDVNKRIFPIPRVALQLNPALVQNPGY
ncbi:RagB/SusD family nutrient uptake outer membrane protein [Dyadobacter sandarakinus]|uniref:RagB/SusD family nutrient uptake outer membrane protein n=1 Tax=Dyadobacter sandarakinus TaxID=2747268 RepID=A0ABX7I8E3_9BACT|nr:RagB/SusD family nutrient uptake outer membrane protein [Dyadobacter sandarakinus]QRR01443.1 RagB/SusD family nutrient uptake outer membrane protein [Dyadobacter sandarakinus]